MPRRHLGRCWCGTHPPTSPRPAVRTAGMSSAWPRLEQRLVTAEQRALLAELSDYGQAVWEGTQAASGLSG